MKKLLLFFTLIAIVCCIFAITASAANIPNWTEITEVSGMPDKSTFGADGKSGATSRVLMSDGITYPAYYICKDQISLSIDFSTLNSKATKAYTKSNIVRIEIPKGTTTVSAALSNQNSACPNLVSVEIPDGVTTISSLAFRSSNISNAIVIPDSCTTIESYAFKGSQIVSVVIPSSVTTFKEDSFSECPNLAEIYCKCTKIPTKAFYNDDSITSIKLENTVTIGENAFCNPNDGILGITSLELPNTLTTISSYAFTRTRITSLVLPASLTTIGNSTFIGSTTLESVVVLGSILGAEMFSGCTALRELVLTNKFETFSSNALGSTPANSTFITYYTGTDYSKIKGISSTTRFSSAKCYTYEDYIENSRNDTYMIIYDCNVCTVAFDGVHTEPVDDRNCTTASVCTVCAEYTFKEALEHLIIESITYASFMEKGEHFIGCGNDGCEYGETTETDELFICQGYSIPENNREGLVVSYKYNITAMSEYKRVTKNTVEFGVFAVLESKIGTNDLFKEDGSLTTKSICANLTDKVFATVALRIVGFASDENKELKLAMGVFVKEIVDGRPVYSYLQAKEPVSGQKYSLITYNDVLNG